MKILIAESDFRVIEILKVVITISQPDWNLSFTTSGKECIDAIEDDGCLDIVIQGVQLSDMSGLDLIKMIRDNSEIPVIFLSGDKDINTLVNAFDAGANDFVVIPFNKAIFIARIKARVRRRCWDIQVIERKLIKVNAKQNICS
jgi:DNA-binding response OmpR family regulator